MPAYRIYKLDGDGRFSTAEWIQADDDDRALLAAQSSMQSHAFELWQANRLVTREESPASDDQSGSPSSSK